MFLFLTTCFSGENFVNFCIPLAIPLPPVHPKASGQRKGYQSVRLTDGKDLRMGGGIVQPALYIYPVLSFPIILAEQPIRERDVCSSATRTTATRFQKCR